MQVREPDSNPADVRGYTWGWVHELHTRNWSFRYASAAMPRVANALRFDRRLFRNRGDVFEGEYRYAIREHAGAIRLLNYENHAKAGNYAESSRTHSMAEDYLQIRRQAQTVS